MEPEVRMCAVRDSSRGAESAVEITRARAASSVGLASDFVSAGSIVCSRSRTTSRSQDASGDIDIDMFQPLVQQVSWTMDQPGSIMRTRRGHYRRSNLSLTVTPQSLLLSSMAAAQDLEDPQMSPDPCVNTH